MNTLPKISIVTPSFNQAAFLERTIQSVLGQNYPNLEYIIIDGGSTDGSVELIKKYEKYLTYWVSEKDRGQSHAINKGLKLATGDWLAWQNSDDIYYPGVFRGVAQAAYKQPEVDLIIGNLDLIDANDHVITNLKYVTPTYKSLLAEGMVLANQAAFWQKSIHEKIGYMDESLHYGMDYDWFLRLLSSGTALHVNNAWGGLRMHEATKTALFQDSFQLELSKILHGRKMNKAEVYFYQLRRLYLMLLRGDIAYVVRGISRRFNK